MQRKTIVLLLFVALLLSVALYGINRYGQASILQRQNKELGQQVNFYVEIPTLGNAENSDIGLKVNSQITGDQLEITGFEIAWVDESFIQSAAEYLRDHPEEDDLSGFFNESPLDFGKRVFLPMINKVAIQNETTPQKVKLSKQAEILTAYTGEKAKILEKVFGTKIAYADDQEGENSEAPADGDGGDGDCAWYDIGCWMGKAWNATKEFFNDAWDDFSDWWDDFWNDEDEHNEADFQLGACTTGDGECYSDVMQYYCIATLHGSWASGSCPDENDTGACFSEYYDETECELTTRADCNDTFIAGGSCPEANNPTGACMSLSGECNEVPLSECLEPLFNPGGNCPDDDDNSDNDNTDWYAYWQWYWASQGDMNPGDGTGGGYDAYPSTTKGACYVGDECSRQKKGVCEDIGGLWTARPVCGGETMETLLDKA